MSNYSDMYGQQFTTNSPIEEFSGDSVKYKYEKDLLLNKHDAQLVQLQIQQLQELKTLAATYGDAAMVYYYEGLIKSRKNINTK